MEDRFWVLQLNHCRTCKSWEAVYALLLLFPFNNGLRSPRFKSTSPYNFGCNSNIRFPAPFLSASQYYTWSWSLETFLLVRWMMNIFEFDQPYKKKKKKERKIVFKIINYYLWQSFFLMITSILSKFTSIQDLE